MQQEPDKEAASVDEVAGQLERQALDEKERDDDDEGNSPFALWLKRQTTWHSVFRGYFHSVCLLCACVYVHHIHAGTLRSHSGVLDTGNWSYR